MSAKARMKRLFQRGGDPPPPPTGRSPRQPWWGGLFLATLIAMGSTLEAVRMQRYYAPPTRTQRWAVGSIVSTFLLALASLALQLVPKTAPHVRGTKLELLLILVATAFAAAAVGTATNPATGMAVNSSGGVSFGNLYYSTWACFACGVGLLLSYARTERGFDAPGELRMRGHRFRLWAALVLTSLVVMGSSALSYDAKCGPQVEFASRKYCRRAGFGVGAGCIGCVGSLAMVVMRLAFAKRDVNGESRPNKAVFAVECIIAVLMLSFYCFAVAYLTGEEGPGAPLGNLYYSTWLSFGLTLFIAASCVEEIQAAKTVYKSLNQREGGSSASAGGGGDVTSINLSNHDGNGGRGGGPAPIDYDHPDNYNMPVEPNLPPEQPVLPGGGGKRSGSVGEVSIAD